MNIAVLGSGLAGLMTCAMLERNGHTPVLISHGPMALSTPAKTMYLERPLPGYESVHRGFITFMKEGSEAGYARKKYGRDTAPTSWEYMPETEVKEVQWAGDLYHDLYHKYWPDVVEGQLTCETVEEYASLYPVIISTLPAPQLCLGRGHQFKTFQAVVQEQQQAEANPMDVVLWSGAPDMEFYKYERIRGIERWYNTVGDAQGFTIDIPWANNCSCHPKIERVGPQALWSRNSHYWYVPPQVTGILASMNLLSEEAK